MLCPLPAYEQIYLLLYALLNSHELFAKSGGYLLPGQDRLSINLYRRLQSPDFWSKKGIAFSGFQIRRSVSFVINVYFLPDGFSTQTPQSSCAAIHDASLDRNCTVLNAKPST